MEDRDQLEQFIKREVDQIQFDGADDMWNEFQPSLPNVTPKGSSGKWIWKGLWFIGLGVALTFLLPSETFNNLITNSEESSVELLSEPLSETSQNHGAEHHESVQTETTIRTVKTEVKKYEYKSIDNNKNASGIAERYNLSVQYNFKGGSNLTSGVTPTLKDFATKHLKDGDWDRLEKINISAKHESKKIEINRKVSKDGNAFQIIINKNGIKTEKVLYNLTKDQLQKVIEDWQK